MPPLAPRLAARPALRLEQRLTAPFAAIGRVESRAAALATAVVLAIVAVASSLVAAFHLGEQLELTSAGRALAILAVIAWVVAGDIVEPLGLRPRDLVGSLAGEVDTYRPVAAARLTIVRAIAFVIIAVVAFVFAPMSTPLATTAGLFALGLVATQAESVARRRAWVLGGDASNRPASTTRRSGRDEELVHALTAGSPPRHPER